jgi:hypothetical protein
VVEGPKPVVRPLGQTDHDCGAENGRKDEAQLKPADGVNWHQRQGWSWGISSSSIPAQKKRARQSDLPCPGERLRLQRIKEREQLLLL